MSLQKAIFIHRSKNRCDAGQNTCLMSLDIPIAAVSSLETLAANGRHFEGLICPIFDARRGQVYTGLYEYKNGLLEQVAPDQNVLLADWLEMLKERTAQFCF